MGGQAAHDLRASPFSLCNPEASAWADPLLPHRTPRQVLDDFSRLFTLKLGVFATELASVFAVPFLLWYALPAQAEDVVDLFREFTVQVDGVGHVCAFAVFDFGRAAGGGARAGGAGGGATRGAEEAGEGKARARARKAEGRVEKVREREASGGKMERSFLNFKVRRPLLPFASLSVVRLTAGVRTPPSAG